MGYVADGPDIQVNRAVDLGDARPTLFVGRTINYGEKPGCGRGTFLDAEAARRQNVSFARKLAAGGAPKVLQATPHWLGSLPAERFGQPHLRLIHPIGPINRRTT